MHPPGQPLAPLQVTGAASAPRRPSRAGTGDASHSVIPKTAKFEGCPPPHPTGGSVPQGPRVPGSGGVGGGGLGGGGGTRPLALASLDLRRPKQMKCVEMPVRTFCGGGPTTR